MEFILARTKHIENARYRGRDARLNCKLLHQLLAGEFAAGVGVHGQNDGGFFNREMLLLSVHATARGEQKHFDATLANRVQQ
jgi:hypothetical protein